MRIYLCTKILHFHVCIISLSVNNLHSYSSRILQPQSRALRVQDTGKDWRGLVLRGAKMPGPPQRRTLRREAAKKDLPEVKFHALHTYIIPQYTLQIKKKKTNKNALQYQRNTGLSGGDRDAEDQPAPERPVHG